MPEGDPNFFGTRPRQVSASSQLSLTAIVNAREDWDISEFDNASFRAQTDILTLTITFVDENGESYLADLLADYYLKPWKFPTRAIDWFDLYSFAEAYDHLGVLALGRPESLKRSLSDNFVCFYNHPCTSWGGDEGFDYDPGSVGYGNVIATTSIGNLTTFCVGTQFYASVNYNFNDLRCNNGCIVGNQKGQSFRNHATS